VIDDRSDETRACRHLGTRTVSSNAPTCDHARGVDRSGFTAGASRAADGHAANAPDSVSVRIAGASGAGNGKGQQRRELDRSPGHSFVHEDLRAKLAPWCMPPAARQHRRDGAAAGTDEQVF
jgi:hypothetical protein